jgi:glycyl-tRNA synthetase beta subunit
VLLESIEPGIEAIRGDELVVAPRLSDATVLYHEYPIHVAYQA